VRSGAAFRAQRHRIWSLLHDEVERARSEEVHHV
jgi:NitT/TauT family transport system ATP-binding protein